MIKKTILLFLTIISMFSFAQSDSTSYSECEIKKNGMYYSELDKETNIYIRFHDGDTVVTTSSENDLKKAAIYINKDLGEGMLVGNYFTSIRTCNIELKLKTILEELK